MRAHPSAFSEFLVTPEQKMLASGVLMTLGFLVLGYYSTWWPTVSLLFERLQRLFAKKSTGIRAGSAFLPDEARLRHTHIVGATGTGKTVLLEQLIFQDLKRGQGAIIVDPKGERSFQPGQRPAEAEVDAPAKRQVA